MATSTTRQMDQTLFGQEAPRSKWQEWKDNFKRRGWILLFILPAFIYVIIFCYLPMYGILVARSSEAPRSGSASRTSRPSSLTPISGTISAIPSCFAS